MDEISGGDNSQIQWLAFDDLTKRWGIVDFKGFFYAIVHQDLPVYKFADGKHEKLDFKGQFTTPGNFNDENVFSHFPKFKEWIFNLDDIEEWDKILGIDYRRWAKSPYWTVHQAACLLSYENPEKVYEGLMPPVSYYPPRFSPFEKLKEKIDARLKPIIDCPSIVKLKSKIERAAGAGKIRQVGTGATAIRLDVKNVLEWALKRGITVPSKLIEETDLVGYSGGFYDEDTWHSIEPGGHSVLKKEKEEDLTSPSPSVPDSTPAAKKKASASEENRNAFIFKGDYWSVHYDGEDAIIKDLEQIRYIVHLTDRPNQFFYANELKSLVKGMPFFSDVCEDSEDQVIEYAGSSDEEQGKENFTLQNMPIEKLSDKDKEGLEKHIYEVWGHLIAAGEDGNEGRIKEAEQEFNNAKNHMYNEYGVKTYHSAKGLSFYYHPKLTSDAERIRVSVTNQISNGIKHIKKSIPSLAGHLEKSIKTGALCTYCPDLDHPKWRVEWNS